MYSVSLFMPALLPEYPLNPGGTPLHALDEVLMIVPGCPANARRYARDMR
jgi:hypothetical protein